MLTHDVAHLFEWSNARKLCTMTACCEQNFQYYFPLPREVTVQCYILQMPLYCKV
jgi:hypothetical protein